MRSYYQQSFKVLPSMLPLKSPSPDIKNTNIMAPTTSPDNYIIRKNYIQYTPPNRAKKPSYFEYSTLPVLSQVVKEQFFRKEQFSRKDNQKTNEQKIYAFTNVKINHLEDTRKSKDYEVYQDEDKQNFLQTEKKTYHPNINRNQDTTASTQKDLLRTIESQQKAIDEKESIISELKQMINLMTENGRHLKHSHSTIMEEDYENMKNQIKILTIQNQKLAEVIQKQNQKHQKIPPKSNSDRNTQQKRSSDKNYLVLDSLHGYQSARIDQETYQKDEQKINKLNQEINQLRQTLRLKQSQYQRQMYQMIQSHKSLALQCKMYQTQKQRYSKQNQTLINLLKLKQKQKETCYKNYAYVDKSQYDTNQQAKNSGGIRYSLEQPSSLKPSIQIQMIKDQYDQNLKQYRHNVCNEVSTMMQAINQTLQQVNDKINTYEDRMVFIESKLKHFMSSRNRDTHQHLTSIQSGVSDEDIKKSAIYIEEAPSSQRISTQSKQSRQALSMILEQSRRDNQKLETQLSRLRVQVQGYRDGLHPGQYSERQLSEQHLQQNMRAYKARIHQLQCLVEQLRQQIDEKNKQILQLAQSTMKIQSGIVSQPNLTSRKPLSKQQTDLISSEQRHMKQVQLLKQKLQNAQIYTQDLQTETNQMKNSLEIREKQLLQEINKLQLFLTEMENQYSYYKAQTHKEVQHYKSEIEFLYKEKSNQKIQIENYKVQIEDYKVQIENYKVQIENYKVQIENKKVQIENKKVQIENKKAERQKLIQHNLQLSSNMKSISENIQTQLSQHTKQLQQQIKQQSIFIQKLDSKLNQTMTSKACLDYQNSQLNSKLSILQRQKQLYLYQLQKLKTIHNKIQSYKQQSNSLDLLESYAQQLEIKNQSIRKQLLLSFSTLSQVKQQMFTVRKENIQLISRIGQFEATINLLNNQLLERKLLYSSIVDNKINKDLTQSQLFKSSLIKQQGKKSLEGIQHVQTGSKISRRSISQLISEEKEKVNQLIQTIDHLATDQN